MNKLVAAVTPARAIAAFSAGAIFFALAFGHRVSPSVMTTELMRDFALSAAALGTLSGWYFYAYASLQIPIGMLNDHFGPRKLMSVAAAVCAFASFGFALSESVWMASLFRAAIGASVAFAFVGTLTIAGYWFAPARFALLAGILQTVGLCGAIIGQAPLRYAVEQFNWRATTTAMGIFAIALAVAVFYIVPRRPQQHKPPAQKTAGVGLFAGAAAVLKNPQSWACAGIGFGLNAVLLAFAGLWAVPWLVDVYHYAEAKAATATSTMFLGWAIAAPILGWLSDHIGQRKPVLRIGILVNIATLAAVIFLDLRAAWMIFGLFFILGVSGSVMTIAFAAMREVNSPKCSATALGLINMFVVGSGAVMQPIIGWGLDIGGSEQIIDGARVYDAATYTAAFTALFGSSALALFGIIRLRETYCKPLPELLGK